MPAQSPTRTPPVSGPPPPVTKHPPTIQTSSRIHSAANGSPAETTSIMTIERWRLGGAREDFDLFARQTHPLS
ncbi:hypothetical protein DL98DRAFT_518459 [Cadophora sp. DSE1049]|nr:hypothetical protein DL98DRAFT_518459 [Cadophora sp. DSE1049]